MRLNPIYKALSRGTFLLDNRAVSTYLPLVQDWYASVNADVLEKEEKVNQSSIPYTISLYDRSIAQTSDIKEALSDKGSTVFNQASSGSVAVIPIKGVVLKDDFCGDPGTSTIARWVQEAQHNPNIIGIVYHIDSPGGSVDGTGEAADIFEQCKSLKPSVTFGDGLIASAGYWLACAGGTEIYLSHQTAEAGSIGTKIKLRNTKKMLEANGIEDITITADDSKDKGAEVEAALNGDSRPIIEEILNPTNDVFLAAVKRNRGEKLNLSAGKEPLTGKIYVGNDAVNAGLVDGFKTLDQCIDRVNELHQTTNYSTTQSKTEINMKTKLLAKWTALIAFFSLESKDGQDVDATLSHEDLERLNAEVERVSQLATDLQSQKTLKEDLQTKLTAALEAHDATKAELAAANKLLDETPAPTSGTKKEDGNDDAPKEYVPSYIKNIDNEL